MIANVIYPSKEKRFDKISLFKGIKCKIVDFWIMVGILVKNYIKPKNLCNDPKCFFFFFFSSKIFIESIENVVSITISFKKLPSSLKYS
jgi:hypothetical protein